MWFRYYINWQFLYFFDSEIFTTKCMHLFCWYHKYPNCGAHGNRRQSLNWKRFKKNSKSMAVTYFIKIFLWYRSVIFYDCSQTLLLRCWINILYRNRFFYTECISMSNKYFINGRKTFWRKWTFQWYGHWLTIILKWCELLYLLSSLQQRIFSRDNSGTV